MPDSPLASVGINDVTLVTGPTLSGGILNWYLYGILTVQYVIYLLHSRNDKLVIKIIVHFIFILDSLQSFLTMDDIFFWFVYNFGNFDKVYRFHRAFDIPSLDAVLALAVQGVYCWRIWVLSGWRLLPIASGIVALLACASGVAVGVQFQGRDLPGPESRIPFMLWLFGSAVVDVVIAGAMTFILLRVRKHSQRARSTTGEKILSLLTLTLETNTITAAVAVFTILVFLIKPVAPPATNFYQLGAYLIGKLYSNCFMILLNQRHQYDTPSSGTGSTIGSRQQGSRTDNIELGSRNGGPLVSFTPSKSKDFPSEGGPHSNVSFRVPGISVSKATVITV